MKPTTGLLMARRNAAAKALASNRYAHRVIPNKKRKASEKAARAEIKQARQS